MSTRTWARLVVSLVVFALCAELAGLLFYYVETGRLFYVHRKTYQQLLPTPEDRLVLAEVAHPYFGFTHRPGTLFEIPESLRDGTSPSQLKTNNFGFVAPFDYPFLKTRDNQFTIGLFGGSVGLWFCELGAPRLIEALKRHPVFRDKEVIPLCFSHEGYKQPQQSLVLAYFLSRGQSFDLVVNIDGFNDVALSSLNDGRGLDFSMPSAQHLEPLINAVNQSTLTPEKLETLAAIFRDRRRLLDVADIIRGNYIASVNVALDRYYRSVQDRYVRELGQFNNLPSNPVDNAFIQIASALRARDGAPLNADIAAVWSRSSLLMHELLAAHNAAYYHFLQPNQYFTTRQFGDAERAVAISDQSPYKRNIEEGYPVLVKAAESELVSRRVRFFNAVHALDRESAPMYMDNCCHYTLAGNHVLADFIAASILGDMAR